MILFVISAPSGAGKSTLCKYLLQNRPEIILSISATTRSKRENETDGVDYHFINKIEYKKMLDDDKFLENAEFCGNYYGTLKTEINRAIGLGKSALLLDIDWQGLKQIKKNTDYKIISIFINTTSIEILKDRLINRGSDSEDSIKDRIKAAEIDISHCAEYDFIIINDNLEEAKSKLLSIYNKFIL